MFHILREFAYSGDGLDLNSFEAKKWALENLESFHPDKIDRFYALRKFAYSGAGLDLNSFEAIKWALENLDNKKY